MYYLKLVLKVKIKGTSCFKVINCHAGFLHIKQKAINTRKLVLGYY